VRRTSGSIIAMLALALSCGAPRTRHDPQALPDGTPVAGRVAIEGYAERAAVHAEIPWATSGSIWGWGTLRVWGRPRNDEIRVHAILDVATPARRWGASCEVRMWIDGRELAQQTGSYVGRPMRSGVYDAVGLELGIEDLRAIADAERVHGTVCGDRFEIGSPQRATVAAFLEHFDRLAIPFEPPRGFSPSIGPDVLLPGEEQGDWATPA
jgi:hypothetical protein